MNTLYTIRKALGITQTEFAKQIGVSFATVNRWENGKAEPSEKTQSKILDICRERKLNIANIVLAEINRTAKEIKKKDKNKIVLYHGSKSGINGTIQPQSRDTCDFGAGFYMGTDPQQPLSLICDYETSKFYILSIDIDNLSVKTFQPDIDWAMFVALNRGRMDDIADTALHKRYKAMGTGKDIIVGSIANDRMFYVLDNFFRGVITDTALVESLSVLKLGQQYVAKSAKACARITIEQELKLSWLVRQAFKEISEVNRMNGIELANKICREYRREGLYFDELLANTGV